MTVAHEVSTQCGNKVTVHGKDVGLYASVQSWYKEHKVDVQNALMAANITRGIIKDVRKK